jgi:hypothetical protein
MNLVTNNLSNIWIRNDKNRKHPMKNLFLALGILLFSTANVLAVEVTNKEAETQQVKVTETGKQATNVEIEAGATKTVCSNSCQIEIEGVGSVNAKGSEVVTIENKTLILPTASL